MAIIQISKIIHRTGSYNDLPQLSEGEFGFATDERRLFIGNDPTLHPPTTSFTTQTEILTDNSSISFSQIDGSLNTTLEVVDVVDGQVLAYDAFTGQWKNMGGNASDPGNTIYFTSTNIHLGSQEYVKIGGGKNGFVLQTDGTGNLTWTSQGVLLYGIDNITVSATALDPAIVTTTTDHTFTSGMNVTFANVAGMVDNISSATGNILSANTASKVVTGNGTSFTTELAIGDTLITNANVTVGIVFEIANNTSLTLLQNSYSNISEQPFGYGNSINGQTGYVKVLNTTSFEVYTDQGLTLPFSTSTYTPYEFSGIVYGEIGVGGTGFAAGANSQVQFNDGGVFGASANLTYNKVTNTLTVTNFTGTITSGASSQPNITTVGNLFNLIVVGNTTTGNLIVNSSANFVGNISAGNADLGNLAIANYYQGTSITSSQPYITSLGNLTDLNVYFGTLTDSNPVEITQTWNSSGNVFTAITANITDTASNVNSKLMDLQVGGVSKFLITKDGNITAGNIVGGLYSGTLSTSAQPNITSLGNLTSLNVDATTNSGNFSTLGNLFVGSTGNLNNVEVVTTANITGNLAAGNISSNGSLFVTTTANVGNLLTPNAIIANGNITGGNLDTSNGLYSNTANITTTANIGNIEVTGNIVAAGNISALDIDISGELDVTGNTTLGNITADLVDLSGLANIKIGGGNVGEVISTDGAGNLSFIVVDGSRIYTPTVVSQVEVYANGNIGVTVGTCTNEVLFTPGSTKTGNVNVSKDLNVEGNICIGKLGAASNLGPRLNVIQSNSINTTTPGNIVYGLHLTPQGNVIDTATGITFGAGDSESGSTAQAGIYSQFSSGYGTKLYLGTTDSYATGVKTRMTINHLGNVGVGTISPTALFEANGLGKFGSLCSINNVNFDKCLIIGCNIQAGGCATITGNTTVGNLTVGNVVSSNISACCITSPSATIGGATLTNCNIEACGLTIKKGVSNGITFTPAGPTGDFAKIYVQDESESTRLMMCVGNDATDSIEFVTPSNGTLQVGNSSSGYFSTVFSDLNVRVLHGVGYINYLTPYFDSNANYFDVFPPSGYTMLNLRGFIMSPNSQFLYAWNTPYTTMTNTYSYLPDRIRVYGHTLFASNYISQISLNYFSVWALNGSAPFLPWTILNGPSPPPPPPPEATNYGGWDGNSVSF